jgi:hypothetical protein
MIDLTQLERNAGSKEGARPLFQKLVLHLIKLKYGNARDIRPAPGDWGIDVLLGELTSGPCIIWQVKYFPDGIGKAQQQEIRDSFKQVLGKSQSENFNLNVWYLCVPCVLSGPETKWWEKWRREQMQLASIQIELMCNSDIESMLMATEAANIRSQFNLGNETSIFLQPIAERVIEELPGEKSLEYESSLFIKKLNLAGIDENDSARRQFFNAEIIKKEINGRGDPEEIKQLQSLYEKIRSMWAARFIAAKNSSAPVAETRKVYSDMLLAIERLDKDQLLSSKLQASFVHKQGFMQQLADDCAIGWSPDFHKLQEKAI